MIVRGNVWKFGDDLAADKVIATKYDTAFHSGKVAEVATHLFEDIDPDFPRKYKKGDIVVAGKNFSHGHGHYSGTVATCLKEVGISALVAESVPDLFLKKVMNSGVPVFDRKEIPPMVKKGDELQINLTTGEVRNITTGTSIKVKPMAQIVLNIVEAGGMDGYVKQRLPTLRKAPPST